MHLCVFKFTLGYTRLINFQVETEQGSGDLFNPNAWKSYAFTASTGELETGRGLAWLREKYKDEGERGSWHSV